MIPTSIEATNAASPAWWSQGTGPGGEADAAAADVGGTAEGGFGFGDFLDVINPLQHIPVVSTIYRHITGDNITESARMTGGALWGGPFGVVAALTDSVFRGETGQDAGATALAWLNDTPTEEAPTEPVVGGNMATALAQAPRPVDEPSIEPRLIGQAASDRIIPSHGVFQGRDAERLDAFIRNANTIRPAPTEANSAPANVPAPGAPAMTRLATPTPLTPPAAQSVESVTPLSLPSEGTDVSRWMMNALDRYQHMKRSETS